MQFVSNLLNLHESIKQLQYIDIPRQTMQVQNHTQLPMFNPNEEQEMMAMKYAAHSFSSNTNSLRLNGLFHPLTKSPLPEGDQYYAVHDEMTIEELRLKWFYNNIKQASKNQRTVDQYMLAYNLDFALHPSQTIGDVKKKVNRKKFNSDVVIRVYYQWDCPMALKNNQTASFSYQIYEKDNLDYIETTLKFRSIYPHNSCYFYVKTLLKTTIQLLKDSIQTHLQQPKSLVHYKNSNDKTPYRLKIKKDAISNQKLLTIYTTLEKQKIHFSKDSQQLDFTDLNLSKIRDICPPGQTIYIQFEDQSDIEVNKGSQVHENKFIRIVCYERADAQTQGAPSQNKKIIEKKVIQRLFSQIRNLKVSTLLHEERIQDAIVTSVSCQQMTIKPDDKFQKFQQLIQASNNQILDLYTFPQNFLYYKAINELESIKMEDILKILMMRNVLKEDARSKCQMKRQFHRQRVEPHFQTQDFLDPIVLYTSPYIYPFFNCSLRGNSISLIEKENILSNLQAHWHYPFSEKLLKSLKRLPNYQGKVFRGSSNYDFNYSVDQIVEWNCFTSTAKEYDISATFLNSLIKSKKLQSSHELTYFFQIDTYSGKNIQQFSFFPKEKQVLMLPYSKFKVINQGPATLRKERLKVTWIHLVEIPIPKQIPGNIVVWIDANIAENSKTFNKIIETNGYKNCDLIQLVSNEHFELWLQQFKETLSLPGVNVQFISNMNRSPFYKQEGLNTLEIIRSFNKKAKVIFYIGNVIKTRDILENYWAENKMENDENIEVVQSIKVLNDVFQEIMNSQQQQK